MFKAPNPPPPVNPEDIEVPIDAEFSLRSEISELSDANEIPQVDDEFVEDAISDHHEELDPEEEERHKEHLRRKKSDKIFNNSYNTGDSGEDTTEYGSNIRISSSHSESHLHDPEKYKDHLDHKIFQEDIQKIIDSSDEIYDIIKSEPNKKKYSKVEINTLFSILKKELILGYSKSRFISQIYILESISNVTTLEYRKLFDMLEYEHKEALLQELNQKYKILDHHHKTKKPF